MSDIKVEIGQYKSIDKGALKASFSIVIYPHGQKISGCKYFNTGTNAWFNFPSFEIKKGEGEKSDFIPYISYIDKDYQKQLQSAVLYELKQVNQPKPTLENHEHRPNHLRAQDPFQSETSELPF